MRSYKMRATLIIQSFRQLEGIYGANNAIVDNCHVKVVYATGDERTAKRMSELVAQYDAGATAERVWVESVGTLDRSDECQ